MSLFTWLEPWDLLQLHKVNKNMQSWITIDVALYAVANSDNVPGIANVTCVMRDLENGYVHRPTSTFFYLCVFGLGVGCFFLIGARILGLAQAPYCCEICGAWQDKAIAMMNGLQCCASCRWTFLCEPVGPTAPLHILGAIGNITGDFAGYHMTRKNIALHNLVRNSVPFGPVLTVETALRVLHSHLQCAPRQQLTDAWRAQALVLLEEELQANKGNSLTLCAKYAVYQKEHRVSKSQLELAQKKKRRQEAQLEKQKRKQANIQRLQAIQDQKLAAYYEEERDAEEMFQALLQ